MHIVHILSTYVILILYSVLPRLSVKYRKMVLTGFVTLGSALCTKLFCRGCWCCCRGCCCLPISTFIRSCHSKEKKINPQAALKIFFVEKNQSNCYLLLSGHYSSWPQPMAWPQKRRRQVQQQCSQVISDSGSVNWRTMLALSYLLLWSLAAKEKKNTNDTTQ